MAMYWCNNVLSNHWIMVMEIEAAKNKVKGALFFVFCHWLNEIFRKIKIVNKKYL